MSKLATVFHSLSSFIFSLLVFTWLDFFFLGFFYRTCCCKNECLLIKDIFMRCIVSISQALSSHPPHTHTHLHSLSVFLCLSLTLCLSLIYNEWTDLLCMLCLHVMSEVRHCGFGPQHVPKLHAVSLTDTLSTRAVHTRTRGWRVRVRRDECCVPLPEDTVNNSCSQTRPLFSLNSNSCLKCA